MRKTLYLTLDNKADDAELVLMEIDDLKRREQSVAPLGDYVEAILRTSRDPFVILGADLRIHTANEGFYTTFKIQSGEAVGRLIYDLGNSQWNIPRLRKIVRRRSAPQHLLRQLRGDPRL